MKDPGNHATIDSLCDEILATGPDLECYKKYDDSSEGIDTSKVKTILDKVFYGLIGVTMFLCFFSLCASMTANLYE